MGRCEKIRESNPGRGDIGKNVERLPFPVLFTKTQRLCKIDKSKAFKTIKLMPAFYIFGDIPPSGVTSPHFFRPLRGRGEFEV
jgi:hypothetical protein